MVLGHPSVLLIRTFCEEWRLLGCGAMWVYYCLEHYMLLITGGITIISVCCEEYALVYNEWSEH
jgi:hypothetical protein